MTGTREGVRAAVIYEPGAELVVREVELAPPREGEVAVRVRAAGLCHSDLSAMTGVSPQPFPYIPGHEAAGVVSAVGPGVSSVSEGDSVLLVYRASCGVCRYCVKGTPSLCALAVQIRSTGLLADGTSRFSADGQVIHHFSGLSAYSEEIVVPASMAIPVPADLPPASVAVIGCAVLTGVGAALNSARVGIGDSAMVVGCGGVGLNVIQGCRVAGAEIIVGVDTDDAKLELAASFGATHTINPAREDVVERARELTGDGFDSYFDVVGSPRLVETGIACVRRGGQVIVIGLPDSSATFAVNQAQLLYNEKSIIGSIYGTSDFRRDVPNILGLWRSGVLQIDELVAEHFAFADINAAFAALHAGPRGRIVLDFDSA